MSANGENLWEIRKTEIPSVVCGIISNELVNHSRTLKEAFIVSMRGQCFHRTCSFDASIGQLVDGERVMIDSFRTSLLVPGNKRFVGENEE